MCKKEEKNDLSGIMMTALNHNLLFGLFQIFRKRERVQTNERCKCWLTYDSILLWIYHLFIICTDDTEEVTVLHTDTAGKIVITNKTNFKRIKKELENSQL